MLVSCTSDSPLGLTVQNLFVSVMHGCWVSFVTGMFHVWINHSVFVLIAHFIFARACRWVFVILPSLECCHCFACVMECFMSLAECFLYLLITSETTNNWILPTTSFRWLPPTTNYRLQILVLSIRLKLTRRIMSRHVEADFTWLVRKLERIRIAEIIDDDILLYRVVHRFIKRWFLPSLYSNMQDGKTQDRKFRKWGRKIIGFMMITYKLDCWSNVLKFLRFRFLHFSGPQYRYCVIAMGATVVTVMDGWWWWWWWWWWFEAIMLCSWMLQCCDDAVRLQTEPPPPPPRIHWWSPH